ncbi:MAG: SDR family oxidoreductase [Candidatus Aenigmarchaeota archaeon]|nr:SDR family oxidoreductase [Candidatus Aenigmarchaeota archaeon]
MKTCLITGASGFIGNYMVNNLQKKYRTIAVSNKNKCHAVSDVENVKIDLATPAIEKIRGYCPDIIIHCAGMTDLRECEKERKKAYKINYLSVEKLVQMAEEMSSYFIFISTDQVFDGKRGYYKEDDVSNPVNFYGRTKLDAEGIIKEHNVRYLICRTSSVYGLPYGNRDNFVKFLIEHLERGDRVSLYSDLYSSPTYVKELCGIIEMLIEKKKRGVFHAVGGQRLSRYELGILICQALGFQTSLIEMSAYISEGFDRPLDSSLRRSEMPSGIEDCGIHYYLNDMVRL